VQEELETGIRLVRTVSTHVRLFRPVLLFLLKMFGAGSPGLFTISCVVPSPPMELQKGASARLGQRRARMPPSHQS